MGQTLFLECATGISGDMVVGALIDLGASVEGLGEALASLPVEGFEARVSTKIAGGIEACDFDVVLDEPHENHDHDMEWLYGHAHEHEHDHAHDHAHAHDHEHHAAHAAHHHEHRTLADVAAILDASALTPRAHATARRIFDILAAAEAKAHGVPIDEVHFHEVGAVDSIVDVVAAAFCLDDLDITDVCVSALAEGTGQVRTAHGLLPIPVPAVANIVADHGLILENTGRAGELVTPTGAAIAAAVRTRDELPENYTVRAVGVGSGKRAYDPPSMVRAMLVEAAEAPKAPEAPAPATASLGTPDLWKLETELDDCAPEALAHTLELLYAAGAAEAHFLPVYMKKNRPGTQLEILCAESRIAELERIIFETTTTIGIRRTPQWRTALPREAAVLETELGPVRAKRVTLPGGKSRIYPEHDALAELARETGAAYQDVYRAAIAAAERA